MRQRVLRKVRCGNERFARRLKPHINKRLAARLKPRPFRTMTFQHPRQPWMICGLLFLTVLAGARRAGSQANAAANQNATAYGLRVAVDEVSLTFHAADAHGLSCQ